MDKKKNKKSKQEKDKGKELAFCFTKSFFRFMHENPDATVGDAIIGLSNFTATFFARIDKEYKPEGKDPFCDYLEMLLQEFRLGRELAKHGFIFGEENGGNSNQKNKAKGEDDGK